MKYFPVPKREQVSPANQAIFDDLKKTVGFVPDIYAAYAYSEHALGRYPAFANGKTSLSNKEKEAINLAVSQVNGYTNCLAALTAVGKMNGFTDEQIIELGKGVASFDEKFNALAKMVRRLTGNRGSISDDLHNEFYQVGYTDVHLIDTILAAEEKTITNYLHKVTEVHVDFLPAPELN